MPLYEYHCRSCGKTFELIQKFSDAPLTTHEGCGGEVERLVSAPAIQFKGTGWYVTDYARNGSSGNGKSKKGSKTEQKSERKSEPKSDSGNSAKTSPTPSK